MYNKKWTDFSTGENESKGDRYMRRSEAPFNGKQFILNKSTGEIHDLDRESPLCRIDKTETDDILPAILMRRLSCLHLCSGLPGTDVPTVFRSTTGSSFRAEVFRLFSMNPCRTGIRSGRSIDS